MPFNVNFDTPQTASAQVVNVAGSILGEATAELAFAITVSRYYATTPSYFYVATNQYNSGTAPIDYNKTFTIAIVPAVLTGEAVSNSVIYNSFGGTVTLL